jgi:protoporphyrinogen oxidase
MVVNLYYANPSILPVHGFGYLLPRSVPLAQNPERALGVVFDSDAAVGQDGVPGTKLTVMLGGHWWDGWSEYPDEEKGASMARALLARHLGIKEEPQAVNVSLQKECIPQYTVGHNERMGEAHRALRKHFQGRLKVTGSSYIGVGLNDCLRGAWEICSRLSREPGSTGLESFGQEG